MAKNLAPSPQYELTLSSVLSHAVFPGRSSLLVAEVARALAVDDQHVFNLIEVGDLTAIDVRSSKPVNRQDLEHLRKHKSLRKTLRIPVSAFDEFLKSRTTNK